MARVFRYAVRLDISSQRGLELLAVRSAAIGGRPSNRARLAAATYGRRFRLEAEGKRPLAGSADPAFRGESELWNPEELLVSAIASCHMLVFLALCARSGIRVLAYSDTPEGTMALAPDGGGGGTFEEVRLRPRVTVAAAGDTERAAALHARANELCFIASSCRFPIRHEAIVEIAGSSR